MDELNLLGEDYLAVKAAADPCWLCLWQLQVQRNDERMTCIQLIGKQ